MPDDTPLCCGRAMSGIGVSRGDGVLLRSCSACGRHAWMAGARELSREELIELLRDEPAPPPAPVAVRVTAPAKATAKAASKPSGKPTGVPDDRRTELQDMLRGFTVHGTSS